jgi:hypothetical protein
MPLLYICGGFFGNVVMKQDQIVLWYAIDEVLQKLASTVNADKGLLRSKDGMSLFDPDTGTATP